MASLSSENLKKRPMENGQCSTSGVPGKWKPRKVSAVRDFPAGCGLDSLPVNMTHLEAVAPFIYADDEAGGVAVNVAGASGVGVEILAGDDGGVEKMLIENNGVGLVEESKEAEVGDLMEKEMQEGEGQGLVKEGLHDVEIDSTVLSNVMVTEVGGEQSLAITQELISEGKIQLGIGSKGKFPRRRVSAVRDFPPFCGWNAPALTEEEHLKITGNTSSAVGDKGGAGLKLTEAVIVGGEVSQGNVGDATVDKSEMKAAASEPTNMYYKSSGVADKGGEGSWRWVEAMTLGDEGSAQIVQEGTVQKNQSTAIVTASTNELQTKNQKEVKGVKGQAEKAGQEIVVYSRDKPYKRKPSSDACNLGGKASEGGVREVTFEKSESEEIVPEPRNKSKIGIQKGEEEVSSQVGKEGREIVVYSGGEPLNDAGDLGCEVEDRVIVQGLMASANCPWRLEKEGETSPDNVMSRSQVKRSAFTTPKNSKVRKAAQGGKSVKGKSKSAGKVAYVGTLDLVVRNEEDFVANDEEQTEDSPAVLPREFDVNLPPFGPKSSSDARNRVRETLRLFQAVCRKILQGEESKTNHGDESKPKQNKRIDLAAAKIVQEKGKEVNAGNKLLGTVPGVEVGDEFQYRVELALVGVHRLYQAGIDYINYGDAKDKVAASIVASGGYDDELDNPDVLIYSGSGGVVGRGKKPEDQKLERGNLALKNSISLKNPVRVIRGSKETKTAESSDARGKVVASYVYDGLYKVERYWQDPGPQGNLVFKFELRRIPGQPELAWKEVKKSKKFKTREGLCVDDISGGKEVFPICAVNAVDNEKPPAFNYITKMIYPACYNPIPPKGCDCARQCYDKRCSCASKNGGEIPYNRNGAIVEAKTLVYECGPSCNCPPACYNRVTQHGIKIQLEIFKTDTRGWGVRSLNSIASGSFICEYIGELIEDTEAEKRTGNDEYLFDIGQNYSDCSLNPDAISNSSEPVEEGGFTIDAAEYGNVGRFVNHSCSPNLYAQNVLYDQEDKRMPHIMLFAAENIPPLQELTYHYNYSVDTVRDSNGNIKIKSCFCGSSECTGRMY